MALIMAAVAEEGLIATEAPVDLEAQARRFREVIEAESPMAATDPRSTSASPPPSPPSSPSLSSPGRAPVATGQIATMLRTQHSELTRVRLTLVNEHYLPASEQPRRARVRDLASNHSRVHC